MIIAFTLTSIGLITYLSNSKVFLKVIHPLKFEEQVNKYAKEFGLDPFLVFAIIRVESNYDKYAISAKEAKGLMQITDKTGIWASEELQLRDFSTSNLFDPEINIKIGCWYLDRLNKEFDGNLALTITAYNGGSGRVRKWLKDKSLSNNGKHLEKIPFIETDNYVKKVVKEYKMLRYIWQ